MKQIIKAGLEHSSKISLILMIAISSSVLKNDIEAKNIKSSIVSITDSKVSDYSNNFYSSYDSETNSIIANGRILNMTVQEPIGSSNSKDFSPIKLDKIMLDTIRVKNNGEIIVNGHIVQENQNINLNQMQLNVLFSNFMKNFPEKYLSNNMNLNDINSNDIEEREEGLRAVLAANNLYSNFKNGKIINETNKNILIMSYDDKKGQITSIELNGNKFDIDTPLNSLSNMLYSENKILPKKIEKQINLENT